MSYSSQNPQIAFASLYASLFNYNNWGDYVYNLNRDWGQVIKLLDFMNGGKSRAISSPDGSYNKAIKRRTARVAQIGAANAVQSGANLVVTFLDNTIDFYRNGDMVQDSDKNKGRVISWLPGQITIEPNFSPATLTAGTQFLANDYVMVVVDESGNFNSGPKTTLFQDKTYRTNYASVQRDTHQIPRRAKFNTRMGKNGIVYYWNEAEKDMAERFYMDYVLKCFFSAKGTKTSSYQGIINGTEGMREAIITQGGLYNNSPVGLTQAVFENMLFSTSTSYGATKQEKLFMMGRPAFMKISSFYTGNIIYTGSRQTANGQTLSFDIDEIRIGNVNAKLMILDFLNDPVLFPTQSNIAGVTGTRESNSIYMIDINPIPADGPEMKMLPTIEKFHFSHEDGREDETIWKMIGGMTGMGASNDTGPTVYNNYQSSATPIDGCEIDVLGDNGIDCQADNWALFELAD